MAIQFYLTDVGRTAALNATLVGLDLQIKHIAVGDASSGGLYSAAIEAATMTALDNELERYLVNGGEIEPTTHTLRFTVNLNSSITADIYEIGLFDENNVLFAVASSTTTPLVQLINEVITIITFGFSLDDVDNITLMLDVNSPLAVTLMNQHTAHEHPHAQYKRVHDASERLKVANGVDAQDAVSKAQLDTKALLGGSATQVFKVANATNEDEAVNRGQLNLKAYFAGSASQRFKVATAVDADEAIPKSQLDLTLSSKADKSGNQLNVFGVANATDDHHAVNKSQLDAAIANIPPPPDLSGKADKNGDANNVFSVGAATGADHAVRKSQLDEKAELNGDSNEYFSVKDGIDDDHAVTVAQLNAVSGGTSSDLSNKAALAGSSTQQFSVADGSTQYHAVNKGQLDTEATARANADTALQNSKAELAGSSTQQFSVADGSTQYHAVNKGQLDTLAGTIKNDLAIVNLIYPVGIVVDFSVNTNPNAIFTGTTWDRFAGGKVTVGFLSGDADFGTIGQTGGKKDHKMTLGNLIEHNHTVASSAGLGSSIGGIDTVQQQAGTMTTSNTGSADPTPIPTLPPYIVTAKWVRIA